MDNQKSDAPLSKDIARIHRVITRGLRVGIRQGKNFNAGGFPDSLVKRGYSDYIQSLTSLLEAHHHTEDEMAFPVFKLKIPDAPYLKLESQHEMMEQLIQEINVSLDRLKHPTNERITLEFVDTLKGLSVLWHNHIEIEESWFGAAKINAAFSPDEQTRMGADLAKQTMEKITQPFLVIPFVLFNLPPDERMLMAAKMSPAITLQLVPIEWKEQWAPMKPFLLD